MKFPSVFQRDVPYNQRSSWKSAFYHMGKGAKDVYSSVSPFIKLGAKVVAGGLLVAGIPACLLLPAAVPVVLAAVGLIVAAPLTLGVGAVAGSLLQYVTEGHRKKLHISGAESFRQAGAGLAVAVACAAGGYAGYCAYEGASGDSVTRTNHSLAGADSLKTAFDQGLVEKTVSQPVAAAASAPKLVIR